jgi:hypothetical protein
MAELEDVILLRIQGLGFRDLGFRAVLPVAELEDVLLLRIQGLGFRDLGFRAVLPVAELEDVLLSINDADTAVYVHLRNVSSVEPPALPDTAVSPFSPLKHPQ